MRETWLLVLGALGVLVMGWLLWARLSYPPDTEPRGAYLRIVKAVNRGRPEELFPYTEEESQHACYTIRDYRKKSLARARQAFPEEKLAQLEESYGPASRAEDGRDVFALYAAQLGWMDQLRRDLSGVDHVDIRGPRATVVTVRKTRYAFRRRPNGIWGLTAFTPTLQSEDSRAARDWALIEKGAEDYERARRAEPRQAK